MVDIVTPLASDEISTFEANHPDPLDPWHLYSESMTFGCLEQSVTSGGLFNKIEKYIVYVSALQGKKVN